MRKTCILAALLAPLLLAASSARADLRPNRLRCEYRQDPRGIDVPRPRLSWIVESSARGDRQTAYQIRVASSLAALRAGKADLWSTGKVASSETLHIPYGGKALASGQECWWQVRCWDKDGKASPYSRPAFWSMGLLKPSDWKGRWIGLEELPEDPTRPRPPSMAGLDWVWLEAGARESAPAGNRYFRKVVELPAGTRLKSALFALTADDQLRLYVNGQEAGRGDDGDRGWSRPCLLDITQRLKPGRNVLAIRARNTAAGPAGLAGVLVLEPESGPARRVPVDATWRASAEAPEGWRSADFDDSSWQPAARVARMGDPPWGELRPAGSTGPELPPSPFLRKAFRAAKPVRRATLYATALGLYEMHLNGRRVGEDVFTPGWTDYRKRVYYQTYDVTPMVQVGSNALGAVLGDGWAVGYVGLGGRNRYGIARPRLLAQLHLTYRDGTQQVIATDGSWKAAYGPLLEGDLLMGEVYDARKELRGWDRPGYQDSAWRKVTLYPAWPGELQAHPGVPVRKMLTLIPQSVTEPKPGAFVFDLGQNMVGWARLKVRGPAGTRVVLRFAERLNPDGTIYTANLRGARCTDTYVLKGDGVEEWEPRFTFHGFQYVEVTGYPGRPGPDAVTGVVVYSATPEAGSFVCSDARVNQLQHNIVWGQRGNFLEVPTDCPQRDERLGWTGDAQVFVRTACNNMDVSAFFTKWLVDLEDAQRDGAFPDVAPGVAAGAGTAAWGDAGTIVPWTLYQVYGDKRFLSRHYGAMTRWVDYLERNSQGLLRPAQGYGDWLSIQADTPRDVLATAYFAHSTYLTAKAAWALDRMSDAMRYEGLFRRIRDAFNKAYVAADGRIKGDTQTCYVLALAMDLLPEEKRPLALQHLVADIEKRGWRLSTGFVGTSLLNPTLSRFGRTDVAYRLLLQDDFPSWLFSLKHGATTIWERWDGWTPERGFQDPGMNSFNHYSFGAVGRWLFATVAGIDTDPEAPGFRRIVIRPEPGQGLTFAKAAYQSIRGAIESEWRREGDRLLMTVRIPANTTALIHVPSTEGSRITEGGRPAEQSPGLRRTGWKDGYTVFQAGSGLYRFEVGG